MEFSGYCSLSAHSFFPPSPPRPSSSSSPPSSVLKAIALNGFVKRNITLDIVFPPRIRCADSFVIHGFQETNITCDIFANPVVPSTNVSWRQSDNFKQNGLKIVKVCITWQKSEQFLLSQAKHTRKFNLWICLPFLRQ